MLRCQFLCHVLKALFFIKIALKLSYFFKKMQNFGALGAPPPDPHCKFLATGLQEHDEVEKQFNTASSIISIMPLKELELLPICLTKLW